MHSKKLTKTDITSLETNVLIDLLAEHTTRYTKMLAKKVTGEEFSTCEKNIDILQSEILSRSKKHNLKK
jgi:hypothetical protein